MNRLCEVAFCALVVPGLVSPSAAVPDSQDQKITVTHVAIEGADILSASQIDEVKAAVMSKPESSEVLMDTARHLLTEFLTNDCYIRSDIELDTVNAQLTPDAAWMHVKVRQGTQYRLHNFRVQWAQAFSAQEVGRQLPLDAMRRGDCSGLTAVEGTVADFYRSRGFQNVKVHSLVQTSKATEQFDITLYIDEGK